VIATDFGVFKRFSIIRAVTIRANHVLSTPLGPMLAAGIVAVACTAVVYQRELVVVAAIGSTIAVGMIWPWLILRPLRARMCFEQARYREGQTVRVRLVVKSWSPIAIKGVGLTGLVADNHIAVGSIRRFGRTEIEIPVVPTRRGEFPPGKVMLTCGLPLGLWHPVKPVKVEADILIWPGLVHVNLPPERAGGSSDIESSVAAFAAASDSPSGVRPYRRGDLVKLIHHGQTARHDRLIVRELCKPTRPALAIILDSRESSYASDPNLFEHAVRITASLYEKCPAMGIQADWVIEENDRRGGMSTSHQEWLDRLARIQTCNSAKRLLARDYRQRIMQLVVITTVEGQRSFEALAWTKRIHFVLADQAPELIRSVAMRPTHLSFNQFKMA
jgi:uncharacterized protein (DUF58 family)